MEPIQPSPLRGDASNDAVRPAAPPARRKIPLRRKLLFLLIVLGVMYAIPEVLVRWLAPQYTGLRFSRYETGGKLIGERGANFGLRLAHEPKQAGEQRIVCIGDSVMWGYGLAVEETIPAVLERTLRAAQPQVPWRCINLAGMGTTPALRKDHILELLREIPADAVICQLNVNDVAWDEAETAAYVPESEPGLLKGLFADKANGLRSRYLRSSALFGFVEYQARLFSYRRRGPIDPVVGQMAAACDSPEIRARWDRQFAALAAIKAACDAAGRGFYVYLLPCANTLSNDPRDNPYLVDKSKYTVDPYQRFDDYCRKYEVPGRNLFAVAKAERDAMLAGRIPYDPLYFLHLGDDNHPNRRGAELFAAELAADVLAGRVMKLAPPP